jgi:hypothetical protein
VLIVAALVAVIYGAIAGWRKVDAAEHAPQAQTDGFRLENLRYTLPKGSMVTDLKVEQGRIVVRAKTPAGEEIDTFDLGNGKLIARIVVPEK